MKRLTPKDIQKRLPEYIELVEDTYKNTKTKALFIDSEHGEFWARYNDIQQGHGHRDRGYSSSKRTKPPISKPADVNWVKSKIPIFMTIKESTYSGVQKRSVFIDKDFGEFSAYVYEVIREGRVHKKRRQLIRIQEKCNYKIYPETFRSMKHKAKFSDPEYGDFWRKVHDVLYHNRGHRKRELANGVKKSKETSIEKYGVPYAMQNIDIAKKSAKNNNKSKTIKHWETGEDLVCIGSYEAKTVEYLNSKKINFDWQIPFSMPSGKIYICDLYLAEDDKYIEIKGFFRKDAKEKWDWFKSIKPNSELWDKEMLKKLKII